MGWQHITRKPGASEIKLRDKISRVYEIYISADQLVAALLELSKSETVCLLDSCGVGHLGSHLLIAGVDPIDAVEISRDDPEEILSFLDDKLSSKRLASIFTLSYDFGNKLQRIAPRVKEFAEVVEPDVFLAQFDCLIIHDYDTHRTFLTGNEANFAEIEANLVTVGAPQVLNLKTTGNTPITSNFTKPDYLKAIERITESIRSGDTYQTNLTQKLTAKLPYGLTPEKIFHRLRIDHPAPFAAFIERIDSTVISASPERFFEIKKGDGQRRIIRTSPIKGTLPRGKTGAEDSLLRKELLESVKDIAENTMIVDLLRNDLGRVCEFGSVIVEKLCDLEEHPTLFHLVSTIRGDLRDDASFSDIIRAVFPCGSITGAPKISTMRIIDEIETANRGLSMGAIGIYVPSPKSQASSHNWDMGLGTWDSYFDLSVAIRTMVVKGGETTFNVGGGIVIDSDPEKEYDESLLKAKALLAAIGASFEFQL